MAKFNYKEIRTSVANSERSKKRVQTIMQNKFEQNKLLFLQEFDAHPITQELENGTLNSTFLGGQGSLRGFIGFETDYDAIGPIRDILQRELVMTRKEIRVSQTGIKFKYSLRIPQESLRAASPMPWESGLSWIAAIETGRLSGLGSFLSGDFDSPDPSRSGEGIQVKSTISGRTFKRVPYISAITNKFLARFK